MENSGSSIGSGEIGLAARRSGVPLPFQNLAPPHGETAMKASDFALPKIAEEGKWFDYIELRTGETKSGVRVKLASADREEFERALTRPVQEFATKAMQSGRRTGAFMSPEARDNIQVEAMARFILLDWEGITDNDGKPLVCNQANKLTLLKMALFRRSVLALAEDLAAFEEQDLGN
jgi:hypothetical protein